MRKTYIAGNWKMNMLSEEASSLVQGIIHQLDNLQINENVKIVMSPAFTYLKEVKAQIPAALNNSIFIAAQNCSNDLKGAHTGEISPAMLKDIGVDLVILGHSERRANQKESNALLAQKVNQALANDLKVIFCCGETLTERKEDNHFELVKNQIEESLFELDADAFANIIIAYEPVWAIGTGKTASPKQAQEMHAFIRSLVEKKYGKEAANLTTILYGGSVKPANAKELFGQPDVDGGLIGGASLKADDFVAITKAFF